jgi:glutaredoxin
MREKQLKIYTSKDCVYCDKLKKGLGKTDLKYIVVDVDDIKNANEVAKIYSFAGEAVIPIITIQPHVLVPKKSFKTIDQALELIEFLMK